MKRSINLLLGFLLLLSGSLFGQADSLLSKGRALSEVGGKFDSAHLVLSMALAQYEADHDMSGQIMANYYIGRGYFYRDNIELALRYVLRAEELEKDFKGPYVDAPIYLAIGVFYDELKDHEQALIYHYKARERNKKSARKGVIAIIHGNLGVCYYNLERYEEAMREKLRSCEIYDSIAYVPGVIENLPWMSKIAWKQGKLEAAKSYLERAVWLVDQEHDIRRLALVHKEMGAFYSQLGQDEAALINLKKAQFYADSLRQHKHQYEIAGHLADLYERTGKPALALSFVRQHQKLGDSLDALQSHMITNEMAVRYKANQKEEVIGQLNIENQAQSELLEKQNTILILSITGLTLTLGISILIFVFYRKTQRGRVALEEKNEQITGLIQELHHRVKNNLQVVSGILKLQASQSEDSETRQNLEGSQQRIMSMALIHENLYRSDRLKEVNLSDYLKVLITDIQILNKRPEQHVEIILDVTDDTFHIDVAIPLGLIANELISNAFKHGFKDGIGGKIIVKNGLLDSGRYEFSVADSGAGLNDDFDIGKTLGLRIIKGLVHQIKGEFIVETIPQTIFKVEYNRTLS